MLARRPAARGEPVAKPARQQVSRFRRRDGEEIERRHAQEVSGSGGFVEGWTAWPQVAAPPRPAREPPSPPSLPATNAKCLRKGAQTTKQSIFPVGQMDCFASLAMTETEGGSPAYSVTGLSEISQSLPLKIEM